MKKHSFTLLIAVLFLVKGIAQQVEQQQRSLVTKRTADWCPHCGTWGWNYFKDAIEDNGDKAVFIAAHYDGGLRVAAAEEISENLGGGYQPRFFLNATDQGVSSGNVNAKLTALKEAIDANFDQAPQVNCGFEPIFVDGTIKVDAKVKFFQAVQGEYYLGVYLLESNVTAYQASIGNNAVHPKLFRASFTPETFGQLISNGGAPAGQEVSLQYSHSVSVVAGRELEVIGIIWKKEGDKYIPVNVWGTDEITAVSAIDEKIPGNSLKVASNVIKESTTIVINLINDQTNASIELFDLNGRQVSTIYKGHLKQGYQTISAEIAGTAGTYFIRLKGKGIELVEKLVIQ
ncbi:MAG: T9SS type A sorting domain-containing protein [Saprospiraceae bacterium]|nr:T9SS type A sorting domain-containing protein [Saprospiraceae bacterium]